MDDFAQAPEMIDPDLMATDEMVQVKGPQGNWIWKPRAQLRPGEVTPEMMDKQMAMAEALQAGAPEQAGQDKGAMAKMLADALRGGG